MKTKDLPMKQKTSRMLNALPPFFRMTGFILHSTINTVKLKLTFSPFPNYVYKHTQGKCAILGHLCVKCLV